MLLATALLSSKNAFAQSAGDFRSTGNGDWSSASSWQRFNGSAWISAPAAPTNTDGVITVLAGDTISVTDLVNPTNADQLAINRGGRLNILTNLFFLFNGTGVDLKVNGSVLISSSADINNDPGIGGSTIEYRGDTLFESGGLAPTITFDGPRHQSIIGQGFFNLMTVDNPLNLTLITGNSFGGVTFKNGKIIADGAFVMTQYFTGFTGSNTTRFIDGNIILIAYTHDPLSFFVPMGKGNSYLPISFAVQKNDDNETHYNLVINNGPPPAATLPPGIDRVSAVRYLNISTNSPENIATATLQMSYDAADNIIDFDRTFIAEDQGGNWVNLGKKGKKPGKVTTTVNFTTLGDFAFANQVAGGLALGTPITSGNIGLTDVYKRNLSQDGRLDFTLASTNSNALNLQLLDGDSSTVLATLDVNGNTSGSVSKDGLAKGKYFIKISPADPNGLYTYTVTGNLVTPAEANDAEPNNSKSIAHIIVANATNTGHVGFYYNGARDTVDWYEIKTGAGGTLKLALTSGNENAVSLTLVGKDGVTVLGTVTANGNSSNTLTQAVPGGNFFAFVTSADVNQFEPYTLVTTVDASSLAAPTQIATPTEDALTAKGKSGIEDALIYPNPTAQQFRVQLSGVIKAGSTVSLALQDINGKTVWASNKNNVSSLNSLAVDVSKLPNGTYFLQITDENKKTITKKIIVSR